MAKHSDKHKQVETAAERMRCDLNHGAESLPLSGELSRSHLRIIDSHQALRYCVVEKVWDGFDLVPLPNVGHCMFVSVQAEFSPACSRDSSILRIYPVYITQYHLSLQINLVFFCFCFF